MYTFKCNGVRAAVHTGNGTVFTLDSLAYDMIHTLTPPLTEEFPMGLRYSFAKFDSIDLKNAYAEVRKVFAAMEEPDAVYNRLTAAHISANLTDAVSVFSDFATKMEDANRFALTILADETASMDTVNGLISAAKTCIPGVNVTVRCPIGSEAAKANADAWVLQAGDMADFAVSTFSELPDNAVISLNFHSGEDLSAFVKSAYDAGCRKLSLVPAAGTSVNDILDMYDKLSRTLTRMYRTVKDFVFLPFAFADVLPGKCVLADGCTPTYAANSLPGYYGNYSMLSHLAEDITEHSVLQKCTEYAIVLNH